MKISTIRKENHKSKNQKILPISQKSIFFYRASGKYGFLSNLYRNPIIFEKRSFPTSEHAYQYGKFRDKEIADWVMKAPKPHLVAIIAHGLFAFDIVSD